MEVSAKSGTNIDSLFEEISRKLIEKHKPGQLLRTAEDKLNNKECKMLPINTSMSDYDKA